MERQMVSNCRLCHYQSYRYWHRSSTTNYTFFGHGYEPKCYFLTVFPRHLCLFSHSFAHTHSTPHQLHVILSFDVFGGLMSIPCTGIRSPSHRQIVVLIVVVVVVVVIVVVLPVLENKYNNNYLDNNFRYLCFSRAQRKAK